MYLGYKLEEEVKNEILFLQKTSHNPIDWALRMQDANCGEIMLTSIDRDGTMGGYDLELLSRLDEKLDLPIIVSGGCGGLWHCIDAFSRGASAVAISSLFLFTSINVFNRVCR